MNARLKLIFNLSLPYESKKSCQPASLCWVKILSVSVLMSLFYSEWVQCLLDNSFAHKKIVFIIIYSFECFLLPTYSYQLKKNSLFFVCFVPNLWCSSWYLKNFSFSFHFWFLMFQKMKILTEWEMFYPQQMKIEFWFLLLLSQLYFLWYFRFIIGTPLVLLSVFLFH